MRFYLNALRRWIVLRLLGDCLVIEKRGSLGGDEWQLIDMKRRIPYGWVRAERLTERDVKIVPQFAGGRRNFHRRLCRLWKNEKGGEENV